MSNGRLGLVAILLVALVASGLTRYGADALRTRGDETAAAARRDHSRLAQMNSFALGLLLGGLRGPLVMMLWTTSEAQKSERRLEDFDTKVEWIRLLQPEFDTVHLFQIWNKAYNISVQMASLANKYITILDAIDYAHRVDQERPNNINILSAIGGVYFDKLGTSAERYYYRRRVREETRARPERQQQFDRDDPRFRRLRHDPVLDEQGRILPELRQIELPHLIKLEPYPHGVSPFAIGYNYHKRAQILQRDHGQRHAQLSDSVIDSRPALALKNWAEEEWELGRRHELQALKQPVPIERLDLELPVADLPLDADIPDPETMDLAIYNYDQAAKLVDYADAEYLSHIENFRGQQFLYQSHRDTLQAMKHLCLGDRDYLRLMRDNPGEQRQQLAASAREHYQNAIAGYQLMILKYYTSETAAEQFFPRGITRLSIEKVDPAQYRQILGNVMALMRTTGIGQEHIEDISEYLTYVERAEQRLANLPR